MSKLNVLFINDGNGYTAQCLQYDIAAQGSSIKEAQCAFEYVITAEVGYLAETDRTLEELPAAPKYFWDLYEDASVLAPIPGKPLRVPSRISSILTSLFAGEPELRVA